MKLLISDQVLNAENKHTWSKVLLSAEELLLVALEKDGIRAKFRAVLSAAARRVLLIP